MNNIVRLLVCLMSLLLLNDLSYAQSGSSGYMVIDSLRLGGEGGWDYLAVDPEAQRLYVSRSSHVQVVDIAKLSLVGDIPNTPGVHGIALPPSVDRGYTSNGRDSSVTVFERSTLKSIATIRVGARNPDAILYDPSTGRVFTFNGGSASTTAIETATGTVAGTLPLGGKPEFAVSDGEGKIFVNIEDKSEIVAFDARSLKELGRWSLAPGEEPSGLAIDRANRRLFAVCGNRLMVILDSESGKKVATLPIGSGVDGAAFDPGMHMAFSSNGEGTMTVIREEDPGQFSVLENIPTRRGARTVTVNDKTHRVYTVAARYGPAPAPTADRPHPRPAIEPGSVTLYVIGTR